MLSNPTIAVIGGTGKSGQYLVRELIQQGFSLRLLLRNPGSFVHPKEVGNLPAEKVVHPHVNITHPIVDLVQGDVRDPDAVEQLCQGCQAVISTLGQPKGEPSIFSQATRHILGAMAKWSIRRYILITGLNVDTPLDKKGPATQAGTNWMKEHYPETTSDKQLEFELLRASSVDWTLVRLPLIGLTEETGEIGISLQDCPGNGIHTIDLARFLIRQLEDAQYIKQAPFLANI